LKNSCFVKIAGIQEIENVYENGGRRFEGFLLQSFWTILLVSEFFNSHAVSVSC